ncbi:PH domain-containing protein [Flavobacterium sp.]|uniref:PH domain-containing protein n=1 Tax=Flavobacterium sp. TaxID=239 RepID=UPI003526C8A4
MVTFKSSVLLFTGVLLVLIAAFMFYMASIILWQEGGTLEVVIGSIVMYTLGGLFIWILVDTRYTIKNSFLFYYSGPIRGKIAIDSIRKIKQQKGWINESFIKPALGINGLYIYYNKYDDIYVSPKDKEAFVNYLLKINPKIEII